MNNDTAQFWTLPAGEALSAQDARSEGLSAALPGF
jgi:hypothetical protein